jgi:predicted AAA+ superfamily ATPase
MYQRTINPSKSNSYFLFGARGVGKSTLINQLFPASNKILKIDLLSPTLEERYALRPESLREEYLAHRPEIIIIDEVQKLPKLLDVIHSMIEEFKVQFILTGSSARKLKMKGANLLAGRAFNYHLYPLSLLELGADFNLKTALQFGLLPKIWNMNSEEDKKDYLRSYVQKYLKEEIQYEQLVKDLTPFRKFIDVAAQSNAEIVNFSNIEKICGVDYKSVSRYYEILADTFLGVFLDAYDQSMRARQIKSPKFYFFDTGVVRTIRGEVNLDLVTRNYGYGKLFETFMIMELVKYNAAEKCDFKFSYLKTKDGPEIDLIIERPGKSLMLIEFKSSEKVIEDDYRHLKHFRKDFPSAEMLVISQDKVSRDVADGVKIRHYQDLFSLLKT